MVHKVKQFILVFLIFFSLAENNPLVAISIKNIAIAGTGLGVGLIAGEISLIVEAFYQDGKQSKREEIINFNGSIDDLCYNYRDLILARMKSTTLELDNFKKTFNLKSPQDTKKWLEEETIKDLKKFRYVAVTAGAISLTSFSLTMYYFYQKYSKKA